MKPMKKIRPAVRVKRLMDEIRAQSEIDTPESNLFLAVFEASANDLFVRKAKGAAGRSAREYIFGNLTHLSMMGIEPEWVQRKIKEFELI